MSTIHPTQTPEYWEREARNERALAAAARTGSKTNWESARIHMRNAYEYEKQAAKLHGWVAGDIVKLIDAEVDQAKLRWPSLGLSFGYLGSIGRDLDDRSWRVFTNRTASYGLQSTADLVHLLYAIRAGELDAFCRRLSSISN